MNENFTTSKNNYNCKGTQNAFSFLAKEIPAEISINLEQQNILDANVTENFLAFLQNVDRKIEEEDQDQIIHYFTHLRYLIHPKTKSIRVVKNNYDGEKTSKYMKIERITFPRPNHVIDQTIQKLTSFLTSENDSIAIESIRSLGRLLRTYQWFPISNDLIMIISQRISNPNSNKYLIFYFFRFLSQLSEFSYQIISLFLNDVFPQISTFVVSFLPTKENEGIKFNPILPLIRSIVKNESQNPNFPFESSLLLIKDYINQCQSLLIDENEFIDNSFDQENEYIDTFAISNFNVKINDHISEALKVFNDEFQPENSRFLQFIEKTEIIFNMPDFMNSDSISLRITSLLFLYHWVSCNLTLENVNTSNPNSQNSIFETLVKNIRNCDIRVRTLSADLINLLLKRNKDYIHFLIEERIEASNIFNIERATYKEYLNFFRLAETIVHLYPKGSMFQFDVQHYIKVLLKLLDPCNSQISLLIVNIFGEIYSHLNIIGRSELFTSQFCVSNGCEIISNLIDDDEFFEENDKERIEAFLSFYTKIQAIDDTT
ncbi:hypothetical protein TRFO_05036 [Tritrichomonas foetus]|uniref:Importin N-terminal domain-containing protein n=1 Tax=Tritrichomonas foetus TaxID=1144522 RepID=A0A1J4KAD3_9EUKA|nr:hypothetical protein TRFO_05036 [Tritrichomonas foetus]|eukprot:OHT07922.1 hypothetical protein TRFO_05036 [Tritrichomonas foetus]